jgi:hypothetical protein
VLACLKLVPAQLGMSVHPTAQFDNLVELCVDAIVESARDFGLFHVHFANVFEPPILDSATLPRLLPVYRASNLLGFQSPQMFGPLISNCRVGSPREAA